MTDNPQAKPETEPTKKEFKPPEKDRSLSEAGGSLSGKIYALDKDGRVIAEFQATSRGNTLREAIDNMLDGIAYGKAFRLHLQEPAPQQAPAKAKAEPGRTPPAPTLTPAPATPAPAGSNPPTIPQGSAVSGGGGTIHAVKVKTDLREDGRLNISFYEPNHQYADISTTRSVEDACVLLAPLGGFTAEHLLPSKTNPKPSYTVNGFIDWLPGKVNSRGKPYKDIVNVRSA